MTTRGLHGTDLGLLHICYLCVTWYFCEISNKAGDVSDSGVCFCDPGLPHPALIEKEKPSSSAIWHTMADWCPWETRLYLRSTAGGVDGGSRWEVWGGTGKRVRRGNFWLGCENRQTKKSNDLYRRQIHLRGHQRAVHVHIISNSELCDSQLYSGKWDMN